MSDWQITLGDEARAAPASVLEGLKRSLREVAATIAALPAGGVARRSLRTGKLILDLSGWRFAYTVALDEREVRVVEARPPATQS
jgi:hypothetical protein